MADRDLTIRLKLDRSQATRENQAFGEQSKKVEQDLLNDSQKAESAKAASVSKGNRSKLSDAEKASRGVKKTLGDEQSSHGKTGDAAAASYRKMGFAAGLAQAGVTKLIGLVSDLGSAFTNAGEKSKALTKGFVQQRDDLGELANLMGKKADNSFTLDFAKYNAKTGFKPEEGKKFLTELYNSGAQYENKNISSAEFKQYSVQAGNLAVARQISPEVVGDVAGSMLGFTDYQKKFGDQASENALGKTNSALAILGRGKGDNSVLARQFSMLSAASLNEDELKGTFTDSDEVAAAVSIGAEKHDAQAAELAKIAGRGLRGYDKKQGNLLKKAGVKPSDGFFQSFEKINTVVSKEVADRQKKTPGFKTEDYLRENMDDEAAIEAWNVFLNKGIAGGGYKDRMDFGKQNAGPAVAQKLIADSQGGERWQNRQADSQIQLAEAERGAKNSQVDLVRKQVLSDLISKGEIDNNASNVKDFLVGSTSFGALGSGEQVRIDEAAQAKLIDRNGGVDDQSWSDYLNTSPTAREDDLRSRIERIKASGRDPLHDKTGAFAAPTAEGVAPAAVAAGQPMAGKEVVGALNRIDAGIAKLAPNPAGAAPPAPGVKLPGAPKAKVNR